MSIRLPWLLIFSNWLLAAGAVGVRAGAAETARAVPRPVFDVRDYGELGDDGQGKPASALPTFDDAIATIVVTIRADAGQEAAHRWTATTQGSVRLVGQLQKTTPEATAEIRVVADGEPIWKRSLREGDSIPHACDVLVCDLSNGSTVDLVVAADKGSPAVAVSTGLQVVPEPFVSRWRVDLPTGYPNFSEQESTALRQKGQDILRDIREASKAGQPEIVIPPGDYLFHARWSQASTLKGLANLEIRAEGVTFWFEPPMIHGLLFEDCRKVTLRGLTIDFTLPCWFQARVMEVERDANTIRATLTPGYEPRNAQGEAEAAGERAFMFYDERGRFINHRHTPGKWRLSEEEDILLCRDFKRSGLPRGLKRGDYIVATIRTGAALRSLRCADMRFKDINVWSSPGIAVNEGGGEGGNVYRRVRATRRPHTNRLHAFGADVFHLAGTDRGPTLDRCEAAYSGDDILNIHGSFGRVVQRVDDRRYYLQGAYEVGDTVEFRDAKSVALLGLAKVAAVQSTPDGPSLAINDRYQAKGEFLVELDRPLNLPELSLAVLDGKRSAAGWVVRNCWFHDDFQRTLINGSPGGLIENTTLQNVGQGLCVQFETWGPWMEGPFARDLVVRNSRFLDAPPDGSAVNVSMHPPGGGSNRRRFEAKPVTNMTITENYFGPTSGVPLCIHNVDGLKISGNSVDHPASAAMPTGLANASTVNWLYLQDCENVTIQANRTPTGKGMPNAEPAGDNERTTNMTHLRTTFYRALPLCFILAPLLTAAEPADKLARDYSVTPVLFSSVHVDDGFWTPRLETSRNVTIPYAFEQCEETDRISNFEKAAGLKKGKHEGASFNDSDVYKIMEGAAYSLQVHPDPELRAYLDRLIGVVGAAQWEDGYLFTFYSVPERQPEKLWTNIPWIHEQYCVGHMYEAAVAHYEVTGDKTFLEIAKKNADLICRVFNPEGRTDPPGHQEIEIGLCKLYRVTGDEKYLDQAKFFLDQRGRLGNRGPDGRGGLYGTYGQDHIPVVEQTEAVGHSVRAAYQYTGMADVAALTGNMDYVNAIDTIWNDVVTKKLYITGGIGAAGGHEGFGGPYELPNMTAYCETCASIANVLWNHRMFLMRGDAKYIDVLERTMVNAALSGISLKGDRFFYPNVLESIGQHQRSPWFGCACCPSNVARFIPSVPGFAYAVKGDDVYVNLFLGSEVTLNAAGSQLKLVQETRYPWDGQVKITVEPERAGKFAVLVRIPGWARNQPVPSDLYSFLGGSPGEAKLKVNGQPVSLQIDKGYARLERDWQAGDTIELDLPMPVRRIVSHEQLASNNGKVALQRGPVVYCLEGPDNDGKVLDLVIRDDAELKTQFHPGLLGGVVTISGQAETAKRTLDGRIVPDAKRDFTAIPYYAWAHRGQAQMTVWPARVPEGARPKPADTLTYLSKTTASFVHVSLEAIKDQNVPTDSADSSNLQLDFWPHSGTTEWVQFEWNEPHELSSVKVYWFDDTGRGACHLPEDWRILYRDADGQFQPVKNRGAYGTEKDKFNKVEFEPVTTTAIKLEIDLQKEWSAGIQEVVIE